MSNTSSCRWNESEIDIENLFTCIFSHRALLLHVRELVIMRAFWSLLVPSFLHVKVVGLISTSTMTAGRVSPWRAHEDLLLDFGYGPPWRLRVWVDEAVATKTSTPPEFNMNLLVNFLRDSPIWKFFVMIPHHIKVGIPYIHHLAKGQVQ